MTLAQSATAIDGARGNGSLMAGTEREMKAGPASKRQPTRRNGGGAALAPPLRR